jgi:hypothetical protein
VIESNNIPKEEFFQHSRLGIQRKVTWDENSKRFTLEPEKDEYKFRSSIGSLKLFIMNCFIPSGGMRPDYYKYTLWRMTQRFLSATTSVFGTQALLLALGFKQTKLGNMHCLSVLYL